MARGGGKGNGDGAGLKAVGGVAVPEALPAEAVQPHHGRHWQVARHQRHQQAPVLRYEVFLTGVQSFNYLHFCNDWHLGYVNAGVVMNLGLFHDNVGLTITDVGDVTLAEIPGLDPARVCSK